MPKNSKLIFAIPSKGRLKSQCEDWLATKGLKVIQTGGERGYSASIEGMSGIEVRLLSSSEIARALLAGEIHLGITGEDLINEAVDNPEAAVEFLARLDFGNADVVVAVPDGWLDVTNMADLAEVASEIRHSKGFRLRVATKFTRITAKFFNSHGVLDYRIVYSSGATEGAPTLGAAEVVVDITTSGATLVANNLKILDDGLILASCACLIKSLNAPTNKAIIREYDSLIALIS